MSHYFNITHQKSIAISCHSLFKRTNKETAKRFPDASKRSQEKSPDIKVSLNHDDEVGNKRNAN
jgi:hypothetical protein